MYAIMAGAALASVLASGANLQAQSGGHVIRACVDESGEIRVIGPGETCRPRRHLLVWNVKGPEGPAGPAGPVGGPGATVATGLAGPTGPEGPAGHDGRDATSPPTPAALYEQVLSIPSKSSNVIPILSFSLGASNPVTFGSATGGASSGKASFSSLNILKMVDALSVPVLSALASGEHIPQVVLTVYDLSGGGRVVIGNYTFEQVFVESDQISAGGSTLAESVSFAYGKITSDVTLNGTTYHSCWNVVTNASCS